MNTIIRNALLSGREGLWDIEMKEGKFARIEQGIPDKADTEYDAKGKLVTPTFVDPHIHLDKVLISEVVRPNVSGTLSEAIEIIWDKKCDYTIDDVVERASRAIEMSVSHGTTHLVSHVDIDPICGLKALEGVMEAARRMSDIAEIRLVAFPQEGIIQSQGTRELMIEAMRMGCHRVGGMPYNEMTYDDSKEHIDFCFKLAKDFDADIDMHVDETDDPNAQTLQYLAAKTIREDYQGRVTAGHTCALSSYNDYYAARIIDLVAKAKINMITNPATNLMLEGRLDGYPTRRGLTRVKQLMDAGVNVAFGQDCIKDTFYPTFGQGDLLEVGMLLCHAAQFSMPDEVEKVFGMMTENAAKIYGLEPFGIMEGNWACCNILDVTTVQEAFRTRAPRLYVFKTGRLVARSRQESEIIRHPAVVKS